MKNTRPSQKTVALLLLAIAAGLSPLAAQEEVVGETLTTLSPHFLMAVVGGVVLAMGFQILLTSLSVASGISLVGNVEEKFSGGGKAAGSESHDEGDQKEGSSPIVKISNAIGVWTVVTASISLFFASLLAVRLSLIGTVWMGVTLGLIIWAAFFATMAYLEVRSVSTLIGGIFTTAFSGMRASFGAARSVFGASTEDKISKVTSETVSALRQEIGRSMDDSHFTQKLDEYVERLRPKPLDFERIKRDLTEILQHVEIEGEQSLSEGHVDRHTFIRLAEEHPHLKREDVHRLADSYGEVKSILQKEESGSEKVEEVVHKFSGEKGAQVAEYQAKIEDYLRRTGREELDPDRIKEDIDRIFEDPKSSKEVILHRLNSINRDTLVAVLAQKEGMGEEKAQKIARNVERALSFVRAKIAGAQGQASEKAAHGRGQLTGYPKKVEDRLRQYLGSIGRPEFDYDRMRLDFERMLHDPKATPKILRARLKLYNRDSIIALLSSREGVSEEDAERMVQKIEEAKQNVIQRAEHLENEVRARLNEAKHMALHEAENVRKASAAAAWWMVGTAVVSGAFSALGAALAISL